MHHHDCVRQVNWRKAFEDMTNNKFVSLICKEHIQINMKKRYPYTKDWHE